ncbi:hypothetical protein LAZ67_18001876 [Cordylochernes scorpioides]|uniref:Reverse transcriptase domain-containing protein n=1 Tax=Cordylochernes scorpioides TaxID=51811 RepID=A0ABY6LH28_9ARAC|nr:hypothetical protein LAZ67_18001876 [Cordylochernes scorpioides]
MEKIFLWRLIYHLDTRNLLPKEQYGFRKGHGTIDQLLLFTQKVKDAKNRKPTNHTIAAFLDLTQTLTRTEFTLDWSGDVLWNHIADNSDNPFFKCETYEVRLCLHLHLYLTLLCLQVFFSEPHYLRFFGSFAGHVMEFKVRRYHGTYTWND